MSQSNTWDSSNLAFLEYLIGENPQNIPYLNSPMSITNGSGSSTSSSDNFDITPNSLVAITPATPLYEPTAVTSLGVGSASSQQGSNIASISNLISSYNAPISNYGNFKNSDVPRNTIEQSRDSLKRSIEDFSDSSDEDSFTTRTSRNKSQKSKKARVVEGESSSRAEQQRMASKRYRQKKKMLVEQLESKLKEVSSEKEKLEKEHKLTLDSLAKIQKENQSLRRSSNSESSIEVQELEAQLSAHTATLYSLLQSRPANDNNLDREITPFLEKIRETLRTIRKKIGECKSPILLNSTIVGQLVKLGFFDGSSLDLEYIPESYLQLEHIEDGILILGGNKRIPQGSGICGVKQLSTKILETVPSISDIQKRAMESVVKRYYTKLNALRVDRDTLNKDLGNFISSQTQSGTPAPMTLNMPMILQAMTTLELTRKNISEEAQLSEGAIDELIGVLNLRQQAEFYIEVDDERRKISQLKKVWDSIRSPQ